MADELGKDKTKDKDSNEQAVAVVQAWSSVRMKENLILDTMGQNE